MSRRRKRVFSTSSTENRNNCLDDPKFHYKCFVHLENCNFSKYLSNKNESGGEKVLRHFPAEKMLNSEKNHECSNKMDNYDNNIRMTPNDMSEVSGKINSSPLSFTESLQMNERKVLRNRKKVDYREKRSLGTPNISVQPQDHKVPIYKKVDRTPPKSRKRKGDLYDFIPESDDDKDSDVSFNIPSKKKKTDNRFKSNKETGILLKKTKFNKRAVVKYDEKVNRIMNKFASKIKDKQNLSKENNGKITEQKNQIKFNDKTISQAVFNSTMLPVVEKNISPDQSIIIMESNLNDLSEINIPNHESRKCIPASENSSFDTDMDSNSNIYSHESNHSTIEEEIENLFGFSDKVQDHKEQRTASGIQILQNIILNNSNHLNPYMSTPVIPREKKSWRFDNRVLNRNPHFISLKKNALPSLNQDPVLDHTFEERINEVNNTVIVPSAKKAPRQQSILNFLESDKEYPETCTYSQSLYDIDELSPIKRDKEKEKENDPHKKINNSFKSGAKRRILGEICDFNEKSNSPPNEDKCSDKSNISTTDDNFKKQECFGFETTSDIVAAEQNRDNNAKPFRIEFTYKNSKKKNDLLEKIKQPVRDSEVRRLIEDDPGFDDVVNQDGLDCGQMGLFEDVLESPKPVMIKHHTKKKTDEKKNKPGEPKLSKEALQWIKQFNSMCDEVDHTQLEIE